MGLESTKRHASGWVCKGIKWKSRRRGVPSLGKAAPSTSGSDIKKSPGKAFAFCLPLVLADGCIHTAAAAALATAATRTRLFFFFFLTVQFGPKIVAPWKCSTPSALYLGFLEIQLHELRSRWGLSLSSVKTAIVRLSRAYHVS